MTDLYKKSEKILENLIAALKNAVSDDIRVDFHQEQAFKNKVDAILGIRIFDRWVTLPVIIKSIVYPKDLRDVFWTLEGFKARSNFDEVVIPLVASENISIGSRDELKVRGIGYFDNSGSLYLNHKPIFVNIEKPSKPRTKPEVFSLFTGSREKVVHALLNTHGEPFNGAQIAKVCEVSPFSVSMVVQELDKREWIQTDKHGRDSERRLVRPDLLLDEWVAIWKQRKNKSSKWYKFFIEPREALKDLEISARVSGIEWALTGASAANTLSPLLTGVDTFDIMLKEQTELDFALALNLKRVDKGGNIVIRERNEAAFMFASEHEGLKFASPFIQYMDLLDGKGRNKELAAQLRENILRI